MEQYMIKPWDTRDGTQATPVDWDMQVPPEVDQLADLVSQQYDMTVHSRTLITSKPDKGGAIWRIETDKGPRSLKVLHRTPERSLYSVGLQDYVVKQGARVAALIPAKDGKLFVEMGGKLWIVTDWIPLQPANKVDLAGAQELCYGLGEFHRHTKGYVPPLGAKNSSRLYRWPNYYQKIAKKIGWMREMAKAYPETVASKSILAVADQYEQQAKETLERLKTSAYPKMVAMGEPHWGLVHQDYGWSNGQNGPGGLWVIDLDGVSYDLPFRDLRKLITSTMDDMGTWDVGWMRGMIEAYHKANPLDKESFEVLLIDMAMPNEFYKHLKEMFFDPVTFLNTEADSILQRVLATDQTKSQALAELAKDVTNYPSGNYEELLAARESQMQASDVSWDQQSWVLQPQEQSDTAASTAPAAEMDTKTKTTIKVSKKKSASKDSKVASSKKEKASDKKSTASSKKKKSEKISAESVEEVSAEPVAAIEEQVQAFTAQESKAKPRGRSRNKRKAGVAQEQMATEAQVQPQEGTETAPAARLQKPSAKPSTTSKVIDLTPHLAKRNLKNTKTKKAVGKKADTSAKQAAQKKVSFTASAQKPVIKPKTKAVQAKASQVKSASEPLRKAKAGKQEVAKLSQYRKKSASSAKRAVSPAKTQRAPVSKALAYSKVAAPSRKMANARAQKPRAQKGLKVARGR
ncbi:CotS family spore coat protein [Brevibacillus sp. SIMBA_040]|uniref:CotS family spore coat protein n=1 Tax=unclassified Brevibacillus TaxID=2684853 RepID=UPI00397DFEFB